MKRESLIGDENMGLNCSISFAPLCEFHIMHTYFVDGDDDDDAGYAPAN
jgi:hypothetical protein